jgi:NAD(P)-dependent dehydrogenase (short-subunit alcohol dehydrogenase family)
MDLTRKVAIITGGARGIGQACARRFANDGASVVITDVIDEEGRDLAASIRDDGAAALFEHHDVSDEASWETVVGKTVSELGGVHVLVNNAGIGTFEDVEQETVEGWDRLTAINQRGVWLGMKHVGPAMLQAGGGSIVNMSSIFGAVGGFGGSIAYHASKGAVRLMTKSAALHWANQGVRVNSVHPGFVDTPMTKPGHTNPEVARKRLEATPLGRFGTPADIAAGCLYLASDDASWVTGSELVIDGGMTAN